MGLEINTTFLLHHHFSESLYSLGQGPLPLPPRSAQCEADQMGLGYCRNDQRGHKDTNTAVAGRAESMKEILNIHFEMEKIVLCSF